MRTTKPDFLRRLFEVFMSDEPLRVTKIAEAINAGDLDVVRYLAHSLKGAAATLGMERVRDACRTLEMAAKDGETEHLLEGQQLIAAEMESVYARINETMTPEV
jgi:HPt (histidine-containing phosphotransfer) domain-containing protein